MSRIHRFQQTPKVVKIGVVLLSFLSVAVVTFMKDDVLLYTATSPSMSNNEEDLTRQATEFEGPLFVPPAERARQEDEDGGPRQTRPMMYTFYEKVKQGEDELIDAWSEEWSRIGFKTRVLTMEDARSHPLYEKMHNVVDEIFHGDYNALCFYRWLAMASTDGGWMSDYDTFPTNFPMEEAMHLPNNGTLTSFELFVPSLISGTSEEWTRVSQLLIDAIPLTKKLKSDMMVFRTVREQGNSGVHFLNPDENVLGGFQYTEPRVVNCEKMKIGRAVHLSHKRSRDAFDSGVFPVELADGENESHRRAQGAQVFLQDWREQCLDSKSDVGVIQIR